MERRGRCKFKKKNKALKACGDCREELEKVHALLSLLQSHLERIPDKGGFHQPSCEEAPGEVCKAAPAGADQPCREPAEEAVPATCPSAALAPLTQGSLPVASTLSTEPQDQYNLKRITLGTVSKSSTPGNSFLATIIPILLKIYWLLERCHYTPVIYTEGALGVPHPQTQHSPLGAPERTRQQPGSGSPLCATLS
eukprot:XP_028349283.1 putative spermatogenesis-associated protein 31C2 [Physeter catodon]